MSLPPISPTGAMSSGNYTDYMITYVNEAIDDLDSQLDAYIGQSILEDWDSQWGRTVTDLGATIADVTSRIGKLTAQARMAEDALSRL